MLGPVLKLLRAFRRPVGLSPPIAPDDCDACDINESIYSLRKFPILVGLLLLIGGILSS